MKMVDNVWLAIGIVVARKNFFDIMGLCLLLENLGRLAEQLGYR